MVQRGSSVAVRLDIPRCVARSNEHTGVTLQPSPVALTAAVRLNSESALFPLCPLPVFLPHNRKQVFHVEAGL